MTFDALKRTFQNHVPGLQGVSAHYAVLVPVTETEEGLSLLFELRADTLGRQPGEICFPGGRMEQGESPWECALRETWEELSIPSEDISLIGPLDCLYHQSAFLLHPFLVRMELDHLSPSPAEVKGTFTVPLSHFREHPPLLYTYPLVPQVGEDFPYALVGFPQGYSWRGGKVDVPIYPCGEHTVWGLTGRIVHQLMAQLED